MPVDINSVARKFEKVGLSLPPGAQLVYDIQRAAMQAATDDPSETLRTDLLAGQVSPADIKARVDQAATAYVVREQARVVLRDLDRTFVQLATRALLGAANTIVTALRPTFDQAAADLTEAHQVLGDIDQSAAMKAGAGVAATWHKRQAAIEALALVRRVRMELAAAGYGQPEDATWWIAGLPRPDALSTANQAYHLRFVGLVAAGYQLRLNTADEAVEIGKGARLAVQQQAEQMKEKERQANEAEAERIVAPWRDLAPKAKTA